LNSFDSTSQKSPSFTGSEKTATNDPAEDLSTLPDNFEHMALNSVLGDKIDAFDNISLLSARQTPAMIRPALFGWSEEAIVFIEFWSL